MKVLVSTVLLFAPLLALTSAEVDLDHVFIEALADGELPDGLVPVDMSPAGGEKNLRGLQTAEGSGARCGRRIECPAGLECTRFRLGGVCMPASCLHNAFTEFNEEHNMTAYSEMIMEKAGLTPKDLTDDSSAKLLGMAAFPLNKAQNIVDDKSKQKIAEQMVANPIDLGALYMKIADHCPDLVPLPSPDDTTESFAEKAASTDGITIFTGIQYELSLLVPKFFNSYYFSFGTSDIIFNLGEPTTTVDNTDPNNPSVSVSVTYDYKVTARVMTDVCGGAGIDAGIEFGTINGAAITGTGGDLIGCSFMFDVDIGIAASVGMAVGVMTSGSGPDTTKIVFNTAAGIGGGFGFNGCDGIELSQIVFEGSGGT